MFRRVVLLHVICTFTCYLNFYLDASTPTLKLAAETFHVHSFVSFVLLILKILIVFRQTNLMNKNILFFKDLI